MESGRLCTNARARCRCSEVVRHRELAAGDGGPAPLFLSQELFTVSWTLPVSAEQPHGPALSLVPWFLTSLLAPHRAQASVSTAWYAPEQLWVCLFLPLSQAQVPPGEKGRGLQKPQLHTAQAPCSMQV